MIVLTNAGAAHVTELNQGAFLTNAFNGLIFDKSNADPAVTDTVAVLGQRILDFSLRVSDGYPKLDDNDDRNTGRGADVWTWKFVREAGEPFVASNVALTNYSGGSIATTDPLAIHGKLTLGQKYDERLIVWVNSRANGVPEIVTATEEALENRVQRVVGFVANVRATQSTPGGSVIDAHTVRTTVEPEQAVWTAASVLGRAARTLTHTDIVDFTLRVERLVASSGLWETFSPEEDIDCTCSVFSAEQRGDPRWEAQGGYNAAHTWRTEVPRDEGTFRLTYKMTLCDDDVRVWRNIVEVR